MNRFKKIIAAAMLGGTLVLTGCGVDVNDSDVVNENIKTDSDNFKVNRRIVFFNGITDKYLMVIEGFCSIDTSDAKKLPVTCKVGDGYKKHYIGLSDNVSYMVEQVDAANVSKDHYKVTFKPESAIPNFELR